MKRDSYYFPHDSNAGNDPKIMILISQFGLEGYGIYWTLIEYLREQPEYTGHLLILKVLAQRNFASEEKFKAVVFNYGLFQIKDEMFFFSESLINRMKPLDEKREYYRELANKRWTKKTNNSLPEHKPTNMPTNKPTHMQLDNTRSNNTRSDQNKLNKKKKTVKKSFPSEIKDFTSSLSSYFSKHIIDRLTNTEKWKWVDTVDKLIRLDKFTKEEIENAVKLGTLDTFWTKQFLSLAKLRKKNNDGIKYISVFLQLDTQKNMSTEKQKEERKRKILETYNKISNEN